MSGYIRDPESILSKLKKDGNQLFTLENMTAHIPSKFLDKGLGEIGSKTYVYGCFPIINKDGRYGVLNICGVVEVNPSRIDNFTDESGYEYTRFYFEAGTPIISNLNVVKRNTVMGKIFDLFLAKGKIPWYLGYDDVCKMFDTALEFAGTNIGQNYKVIEFLVSIMGRYKNDRMEYIRTVIEKYEDLNSKNMVYVPIASVQYSAKSTLNKLAGNYFKEGVVSALAHPTDVVNPIERLLRL